jgi:hypothetical protein
VGASVRTLGFLIATHHGHLAEFLSFEAPMGQKAEEPWRLEWQLCHRNTHIVAGEELVYHQQNHPCLHVNDPLLVPRLLRLNTHAGTSCAVSQERAP